MTEPLQRLRLDKWLWAARFMKTRAMAVEQIEKGRVKVNGADAKPSRELKLGDELELRNGPYVRTVQVLGLSAQRGPAPAAALMYEETAQSLARREQAAQARAQGVEPALAQAHGRPTKRDRRDLADWQRWSASADDPGK